MPKTPVQPIPPDAMGSRGWTVGELARLTNCTLRSIRFYEEQGLLSVPGRTGGRHRRYTAEQLERLQLIADLRRAGLSIDHIRSIIDVKHRNPTGGAASRELRRLLAGQVEVIAERLKSLHQLKENLERVHDALLACTDCRDGTFPAACAHCSKPAAMQSAQLVRTLWSHRQ